MILYSQRWVHRVIFMGIIQNNIGFNHLSITNMSVKAQSLSKATAEEPLTSTLVQEVGQQTPHDCLVTDD